jgi:hypothetical protein
MILRKTIVLIFICFSTRIFAQEADNLFFYIPNEVEMSNYMDLHTYLNAWDKNEITINNESLATIFSNYVGKDTLESLFFESFLRCTKNKDIHKQVLEYLNTNKINTNFANCLRKLYSAFPKVRRSNGKDYIYYVYNNSEYDENIDLFSFDEVGSLDREIGLLLFNNKWDMFSIAPSDSEKSGGFFLICGGDTNSMSIHFNKYTNTDEKNIEKNYKLDYYNRLYNNWKLSEITPEGILNRAGADKIAIGYGIGTDRDIKTIEMGTFNIYLYNKQNKTLYEIGYYMNFSPQNILFTERNRIFNFLLFQLLFVFIK